MHTKRSIGLTALLTLLALLLAACEEDIVAPQPEVERLETQACTRTWSLLERGDSNRTVTTAQYLLRARGQSLSVDGAFGPSTESAVERFQASRGLTQDGRLSKNTWEALVMSVQSGSEGDAVRAVQYKLGISVDGTFGLGTQSAVVNFQNGKGLSADGGVGLDTWAALVGSVNCASGTRAQLAQQILDNSRITLGTSSSTPGGSPRQNMLDTAAGKPVQSGCFDLSRCDATVYLSTKLLQAMLQMAQSNSYYVTSLGGGRHSAGSDHYKGRGLDLGIWNGQTLSYPNSAHTSARNACIGASSYPGQTFNAYNEPRGHSNHVHCAFY